MNSLRLPPLNFGALPYNKALHCQFPPIPLYPHVSHPYTPPLPSLSPLLNDAANVLPPQSTNRPSPSPIASYRQSYTPKSLTSPTSSASSTPLTTVLTPRNLPATPTCLPPSIPNMLSNSPISVFDSKTPISPYQSPSVSPPSFSRSTLNYVTSPPSSKITPQHYSSILEYRNPSPVTTTTTSSTAATTVDQAGRQPQKHFPIAPVKRAIQTPKGVREVYTCPFPSCTRISSEHSNMKAHMRLHTGERPYICRVASCGKSFRWKSSLTYHERALHSNSRPYQCASCQKSFVEKRKLRLHHQLCPAIRAAHSQGLPYDHFKSSRTATSTKQLLN